MGRSGNTLSSTASQTARRGFLRIGYLVAGCDIRLVWSHLSCAIRAMPGCDPDRLRIATAHSPNLHERKKISSPKFFMQLHAFHVIRIGCSYICRKSAQRVRLSCVENSSLISTDHILLYALESRATCAGIPASTLC